MDIRTKILNNLKYYFNLFSSTDEEISKSEVSNFLINTQFIYQSQSTIDTFYKLIFNNTTTSIIDKNKLTELLFSTIDNTNFINQDTLKFAYNLLINNNTPVDDDRTYIYTFIDYYSFLDPTIDGDKIKEIINFFDINDFDQFVKLVQESFDNS